MSVVDVVERGHHDFQLSAVQTCGERIEQLRRQIVVHSCLYYELNQNIISDQEFDDRAYELATLQKAYPDVSLAVPYELEAFKRFDGSTGFDLPIRNLRTLTLAESLLDRHIYLTTQKEL